MQITQRIQRFLQIRQLKPNNQLHSLNQAEWGIWIYANANKTEFMSYNVDGIIIN